MVFTLKFLKITLTTRYWQFKTESQEIRIPLFKMDKKLLWKKVCFKRDGIGS